MTAPVTPIDTPLMRWAMVQAAVLRAQREQTDEAIAAVDEAVQAYDRAYRRRKAG